MRKVITFLAGILLGTSISLGQENSCKDTELYDIVFKNMKLYERKAADIQIGYKPNEFTINTIKERNLFSIEEENQLDVILKDTDYTLCNNLQSQIISIISRKKIHKNGSYNSYRFSKVITLSDIKKCILFKSISKNKNYEGGKAMGTEIIYIYSKKNNIWSLTDKQGLVMY